jgi:type 1 fimbria pilin
MCDQGVVRIPSITATQHHQSFNTTIPCLLNSECWKPGNDRLPGCQDHIWCPLAHSVTQMLSLQPSSPISTLALASADAAVQLHDNDKTSSSLPTRQSSTQDAATSAGWNALPMQAEQEATLASVVF